MKYTGKYNWISIFLKTNIDVSFSPFSSVSDNEKSIILTLRKNFNTIICIIKKLKVPGINFVPWFGLKSTALKFFLSKCVALTPNLIYCENVYKVRTTFFKAWPVKYFSTLITFNRIHFSCFYEAASSDLSKRKGKLQSTHLGVNFFFHRNTWKMIVFIMVIMFSKISTGAGNHCQWSVHSMEQDKHLFYPLKKLPAVLSCISRIIALSINIAMIVE